MKGSIEQHTLSHALNAFAVGEADSVEEEVPFDMNSSATSVFIAGRCSRIIMSIMPPITIGHSRNKAVDHANHEEPTANSVAMAIRGTPMHRIIMMREWPRCFLPNAFGAGVAVRSARADDLCGRCDILMNSRVNVE